MDFSSITGPLRRPILPIMGFTKSKTESEEVLLCKKRTRCMERAVRAGNKFVAANKTHAISLKKTGAILNAYGEFLNSAGGADGGGGPPQIFGELYDCFLKACQSADEAARLLEATPFHCHSNSDDMKDDRVDVLDKLLAWEEKLCDEVKASEQIKLEYEKKFASLSTSKKKHGSHIDALDRMKAKVSQLHARCIVDVQSMEFNVSEIDSLCDGQLYPKLVTLVDAMATMWEKMGNFHEKQYNVVRALRHWNISQSPSETSKLHHDHTLRLFHVVQEWHTNFSELIFLQNEYVEALNEWVQLRHVGKKLKEEVRGTQNPPIRTLLRLWHSYLKQIPDKHTKDAISNFAGMIHSRWLDQKEEFVLKKKCERSNEKKIKIIHEFEKWHAKYRRTGAVDEHRIAERQKYVEAAELKFEGDEEAHQMQCDQSSKNENDTKAATATLRPALDALPENQLVD